MFKYFEILEDLIFQFSISLDLSLHDYKGNLFIFEFVNESLLFESYH